MKPIFLLLLMPGILGLHRATAREPVTIAFSDPLKQQSEFVRALAGLEEVNALEATVSGKIAGRSYRLDLVHVVGGKQKRLMPMNSLVCKSDTLRFYMISKPVAADSAKIVLRAPIMRTCALKIAGADRCIAMETYPEKQLTTADTIAVMAFSQGEPVEVPMPDGNILRGYDYCSVRDGHIHPSKWHERFKLNDYVYFEIVFTDDGH